jgi:hypothetical protein
VFDAEIKVGDFNSGWGILSGASNKVEQILNIISDDLILTFQPQSRLAGASNDSLQLDVTTGQKHGFTHASVTNAQKIKGGWCCFADLTHP